MTRWTNIRKTLGIKLDILGCCIWKSQVIVHTVSQLYPMYCLLILYGPIIFWREWSAMIIGSMEHWEIYFSAVIAFQTQVPNGETLFQRQRRILPNRSASTLSWTWQPISIFGNFYKLPNMWLQPGRCIALWKICIKTSIFVFLSLANYEQNQYKVSTLEREWAA